MTLRSRTNELHIPNVGPAPSLLEYVACFADARSVAMREIQSSPVGLATTARSLKTQKNLNRRDMTTRRVRRGHIREHQLMHCALLMIRSFHLSAFFFIPHRKKEKMTSRACTRARLVSREALAQGGASTAQVHWRYLRHSNKCPVTLTPGSTQQARMCAQPRIGCVGGTTRLVMRAREAIPEGICKKQVTGDPLVSTDVGKRVLAVGLERNGTSLYALRPRHNEWISPSH
jgi:hypothetical protein